MASEGGLEDLPLIDLFRSEVEAHSDVLSAALLALERAPHDTSRLGEMMRAAHSIKGAARVVGVEPAIRVSHVMEDYFVAAQKGALALSPPDVDVLLRGVDLLGKISEGTRDLRLNLATEFEGPVKSFVIELEALLRAGEPTGRVEAATGASQASTPGTADQATSQPAPPQSEPVPLPRPNAITIAVPEVLDSTAADEIRKQFISSMDQGCDSVNLDLRATKDLDAHGLVLLAAMARHAAKHGRPRIRLTGASEEMETVLKVTGIRDEYALVAGAKPEDA